MGVLNGGTRNDMMPLTLGNLRALPPGRFEVLVAELMELSGFQNVVLLGGSGDEGIDIRADWPETLPTGDTLSTTWAVQCKRYTSPIAPKSIQEILNYTLEPPTDLLPAPPDYFLLATTSRLTPNARRVLDRANSHRAKYSCKFVVWEGEAIVKRVAAQPALLDRFFQRVDDGVSERIAPGPLRVVRLSILLDPAGDDVLITFMIETGLTGPATQRTRTQVPRDEFDQLVEECQRLASTALFASFPEESERLLKETGRRIHGLFPESIMNTLREHKGSYIRIASNIHIIPFELAFDDVLNEFLGERCSLGRIQVSEASAVEPLAPEPSILLIGSLETSDVPPLPGAAMEFKALSDTLSRWGLRVTGLSGKSATRDELEKVLREQRFQLLHFAGHGISDADGRAGLFLSDGFISFEELTRIAPSASVVVLNACSSGAALDAASRGYFQAGASAVVGFVGPVSDEAANVIAARFYEEIGAGLAVGDALRAARMAQRAQRPTDYSWASLVLFGDPTRRLRE